MKKGSEDDPGKEKHDKHVVKVALLREPVSSPSFGTRRSLSFSWEARALGFHPLACRHVKQHGTPYVYDSAVKAVVRVHSWMCAAGFGIWWGST